MKIRGTTVSTNIKPEKVLVKCENLTEDEKALARANIGAASAETIGDMETALDAIIAIQNELMGVEETVSFTISGQSSTDHYTVPRGMTWGEIAEARLLSYQCNDCQTKNGTLTIVFIERDVVYYQACSECDGSAYELYTDEGMSTCVYADEYPLDGHVYCS